MTIVLMAALAMTTGPAQGDVPVTITYTADNIVGAWWQNGDDPQSRDPGGNSDNWRVADTDIIHLNPGHDYQFVWQVQNSGSLSSTNPAGFLAQIACSADPNYNALSHADVEGRWEWALVGNTDPDAEGFSFDQADISWSAVNEFCTGGTEAWNGGDNIWTDNNSNQAVALIAGEGQLGVEPPYARWIWAEDNENGDLYGDIFIRYNASGIELVPEPIGASLFGLASALLLLRRRRRN